MFSSSLSGSGRGWRGRDSRGRGGSSGYPGRGGSKFYKASYSDDAKENVDKLFNKKYVISIISVHNSLSCILICPPHAHLIFK